MKDNQTPDKILAFSQLYSRLLAEPVLQQKWAVLYLLYRLADTGPPSLKMGPPSYHSAVDQEPGHSRPSEQREFVVDSPAFNEAFSNPGLLKLPTGDETRQPKSDRPVSRHRDRKDRQKEAKPDAESSAAPSPQPQNYVTYETAEPAESALLRDLPFVLQGLSTTNLVFRQPKSLQLPATLPAPLIGLLHTLAEPCLLYKSLSEFVESDGGGLVGQSFRSALGLELRQYLKLVASLEVQTRRALATLDESEPRNGIGKTGVTLKRCVYWTREATMGLRLMSLMVEESKGKLLI
jgi:gamma-tubulin complex component 3